MIKLLDIPEIDQDVMFWRNPRRVSSDDGDDFALVSMKHESNIDVLTSLVQRGIEESNKDIFDFELPAYTP